MDGKTASGNVGKRESGCSYDCVISCVIIAWRLGYPKGSIQRSVFLESPRQGLEMGCGTMHCRRLDGF